ncbi:MAG: ABC transporter permease [Pseudomonadota bacterium]
MDFILKGFADAWRLVFSLDPDVYFIVWTSLKVSLLATLLSSILGVPLGVLTALKRFRGKSALQVILNTMMAFPTVVIGLLFYALLSRRGPLGPLELLFTPAGISIGLFFLGLPTVVNLTLAAVQGLDPRLMVTCKVLGATPMQTTGKILREARFAITSAVVVAFGRVISEVGVAMMLGGNIRGLTRTMTTAIALETSKGEFELGLALGIVLLAVALAVNGALFVLQRGKA